MHAMVARGALGPLPDMQCDLLYPLPEMRSRATSALMAWYEAVPGS